MKKKGIAVYAGSFDLLTNGHLWMIRQGAALFDKLIVAVGVNAGKECMFSVEERVDMLRRVAKQFPNVTVESFVKRYLIHYTHSVGAQYLLRGIRSPSDYESEKEMRFVHEDKRPKITTIFLMPPRKLSEVRSSMVKGLIGPRGWEKFIKDYVPGPVLRRLKEIHHAKQ